MRRSPTGCKSLGSRNCQIKPFLDAGFDEIALLQIGADQQKPFFEWAEKELLPARREL
jgi:hypothetical protein